MFQVSGFSNNQQVNFNLNSKLTLPTKAEAQKVFWALGDDFWKQIIDGRYQKHGPMVFDQGLHGKDVEPGFFGSLKSGCEFTSEHLGERPTVTFYKELHAKLCAHFKGDATRTNMDAKDAGKFNKHSLYIYHKLRHDSDVNEKQYKIIDEMKSGENMPQWIIDMLPPETLEKIKELKESYPAAKAFVDCLESEATAKCQRAVESMNERFSQLGIEPYCSLQFKSFGEKENPMYYLRYFHINDYEVERIVHLLFDRYNNKIDEINAKYANFSTEKEKKDCFSEKITAIADLFQMLEWLHPFADGQGRTDLSLLSKLLTEQGLNPAILEEPYMSSWSDLSDWKEYLENGVARWNDANPAR